MSPRVERVDVGKSSQLNCTVSGTPVVSLQWLHNGQPIATNSRIRLLAKDVLHISNVERRDKGMYQCLAHNDLDSVQASAQIELGDDAPVFLSTFSEQTLQPGQSLSLKCVASGNPIPQVTWRLYDNIPVPESSRYRTGDYVTREALLVSYVNISSITSEEGVRLPYNHRQKVFPNGSLTVVDLERATDEGRYTCIARQAKDAKSAQGHLYVQIEWYKDGHKLTNGFLSKTNLIHVTEYSLTLAFESVQPDHRGNYTCVASNAAGSSSHSASMIIHGLLREPPNEFKSITSNSHLRPYENGSLAVHNAQRADSGYYMCAATNGIGAGLSKVIKLTVNVAAHFESKFRAETVRKGLEARIRCEAIGDKPITISWLKDKLTFNPRDDPRYELLEAIVSEGIKSEIVIRNADRRDSALFSCVTTNAYGHDDTNIQLIMQEPPDAPSDLKILEHDDKWTTRTPNVTVSASETSVLVGGLRPVTVYQIRVFAINGLGKSESSQVIVLKTIEETPGGPPLHIKAVPLSSKSIKVSWKPPRKDLQYGLILGYYIGYKTSESANLDQLNKDFVYKTLEVKNEAIVEECTVNELTRSTKYQIIVQAYNSKGAGPSSEPTFVKTLEMDPPSTPTLRVLSATTNSIQLSWIMNSDDSTPATGFILHHKRESADWDELRLTDTKSYAHQWLKCGTRYQYYLIAFNTVGKSDASSIVSAKTEGASPVAPDKNSLLSVNTTTATIFLDAFHDGGCPVNMFEVMYKLQKSRKWISLSNRAFTDQKHIVLSDLMPSTSYDIKITAFNEAGSTEAQYSFTTSSLALQDDEPGVLSSSKSAPSVPFYADVLVVVPSIISPNKVSQQDCTETVNLTELDASHVKKLSMPSEDQCQQSMAHFPTPYAMTKVNDTDERVPLNALSRQSPLKSYNADHEAIYATVKRTPRQPRSDVHIYCTETVNLTELDASHVKKLSMPSEDQCQQSMAHFPTPYAMTKVNDTDERVPLNALSRQSPLKSYNADHEAIYATVKRTPRQPRSDVHIYQYPTTVQPDSGCEVAEGSNMGHHWRTSVVRFDSDPQSVKLFACDPQTGLIYGRRDSSSRSSHHYK
ncbi:unnamed protein product [Medioppia subpectinata]|uniref:Uncharacterized protein n=1 Tax=Medioppia subpectinata TaxID=1979941 RepID=A0A7R9KEU4_9ACAR|nr:unnamed protein product [Medioppia subpectinata]CAG2102033.1 unnamed protein product [Medioppia subpectinata]